MKEKIIEKWIAQYLALKWAIVEWMQSWKIMIKKWDFNHRMTLQSEWCPDIFCFYLWNFVWIEVKKNQKEVDDWLAKEKRFEKEWSLPISYRREEMQIRYKKKILKNGWTHIITCDIDEVIWFIDILDEKSKKDLTEE